MEPTIQVGLKLRGNELVMALRAGMTSTRRLPSYCANKACNAISYRAWKAMPKVDAMSINQELEVSTHGVTATGRLSKAKKPRRVEVGSHSSSLASRIVLARFYKDSPYNARTAQIYALQKPDTHGTADFWAWVANVASRMVKARRSSTGFYAACARAVNVGFGMAVGRFKPKSAPTDFNTAGQGGQDVNKVSTLLSRGLAQVYPAEGDSGLARFTVASTEPDAKAGRHDLERVAGRVWQEAVDAETVAIYEHIAKTYAGAMREAGFVVKTS